MAATKAGALIGFIVGAFFGFRSADDDAGHIERIIRGTLAAGVGSVLGELFGPLGMAILPLYGAYRLFQHMVHPAPPPPAKKDRTASKHHDTVSD